MYTVQGDQVQPILGGVLGVVVLGVIQGVVLEKWHSNCHPFQTGICLHHKRSIAGFEFSSNLFFPSATFHLCEFFQWIFSFSSFYFYLCLRLRLTNQDSRIEFGANKRTSNFQQMFWHIIKNVKTVQHIFWHIIKIMSEQSSRYFDIS